MNCIREMRVSRGWTQAELAARAKVHQTEVSALETDRAFPSADVMNRIWEALTTETECEFLVSQGLTLKQIAKLSGRSIQDIVSLYYRRANFPLDAITELVFACLKIEDLILQ